VTCKKDYPDEVVACPVHGTSLVSEEEMSDTITARASMAAGGGTPGPIPVVRSGGGTPSGAHSGQSAGETPGEHRSTQGGSLRDTATQGSAGPTPISTDAIVGTTLMNRYEVTRKIGEGGMGVVYEARHILIGKRVAIKVLLDKYAQKADIVARLQQEARLASSIGHEHIIDITDFGETSDGRTFVVMEYLEGESLAQLLTRDGPLSPARVITIARQVASALAAAHGKGVIHRDVKPENVFLVRRSGRDFAKVVDFGISKATKPEGGGSDGQGSSSPRLTHTGMVLGTPLYMSPEQARGEDELDHRIDVYALGVIMYEMLTGEVPFRGSNYLSVISQVLSVEPKRPSQVRPDLQMSAALESVVLRAMTKDRAERYQSCAELDADLARLEQGDEVVQALSKSAVSGARPRAASPIALLGWVLGVAALLAATVALVIALTRNSRETPKPPAAPTTPAPTLTTPPPEKPKETPPRPAEDVITMVKIRVTSEPEGAEIFDGSVLKGTTPADLQVPKGKDRIVLRLFLKGYEVAEVPFNPTSDQNIPVALKKARRGAPQPKRPGEAPATPGPTLPQNSSAGPTELPPNPYVDAGI
jgi:serine/threonine-protein kinase